MPRMLRYVLTLPVLLAACEPDETISGYADPERVYVTGLSAGTRGADGTYPSDTVFARVDAKLTRLADEVARFGRADAPF